MTKLFDDLYLHVAWWAAGSGQTKLGQDEFSRSLICVLDIGGMLWEGEENYDTVAAIRDEVETLITQWREENGYQRYLELNVCFVSDQCTNPISNVMIELLKLVLPLH